MSCTTNWLREKCRNLLWLTEIMARFHNIQNHNDIQYQLQYIVFGAVIYDMFMFTIIYVYNEKEPIFGRITISKKLIYVCLRSVEKNLRSRSQFASNKTVITACVFISGSGIAACPDRFWLNYVSQVKMKSRLVNFGSSISTSKVNATTALHPKGSVVSLADFPYFMP